MSGRLRHRVTIQRRASGQDEAGQPVDTWTDYKTVWAEIKPMQGEEYYTQTAERAEITHELRMRGGITVRPRDRIRFGGRTFDIEHVADQYEIGKYLKVMVVENV